MLCLHNVQIDCLNNNLIWIEYVECKKAPTGIQFRMEDGQCEQHAIIYKSPFCFIDPVIALRKCHMEMLGELDTNRNDRPNRTWYAILHNTCLFVNKFTKVFCVKVIDSCLFCILSPTSTDHDGNLRILQARSATVVTASIVNNNVRRNIAECYL